MDKDPLPAWSPPPYETTAYPHSSRSATTRRLRRLTSFKSCLAALAVTCLVYLCISASYLSRQLDNTSTQPRDLKLFANALAQCAKLDALPVRIEAAARTSNPRWYAGQTDETVVIRNAKLFDGETFLSDLVDIHFKNGLITHVDAAGQAKSSPANALEFNVHGRFVTPGLVDMHSHHMVGVWPATDSTDDGNEVNPDTKSLAPMMRAIDGLKAYDVGTEIIMSGGITTSLILPGSANLVGGEAVPVKNVLFSGKNREPVVEELLLERGVPVEDRHRYMKMAMGENPRRVWDHTRMGNVWQLRDLMQKAKEIKDKQDQYCNSIMSNAAARNVDQIRVVREQGKFPFDLSLESTVALLRGQVLLQNHNYEPEDMEGMLRVAREFGYKVTAFHHALEAWQVPEMLNTLAENITIATFAEFSLYKWEAYMPSLHAGYILDKHGVSVAYKSDHGTQFTNAKYLASQAAVAHSFELPEHKALQAITSVPAKAIEMDNRVGYCRVGYDADIVVWDSHPLSLGATPMQVFIDGRPQLNQTRVKQSMGSDFTSEAVRNERAVHMRHEPSSEARLQTCTSARRNTSSFIISGITKTFVHDFPGTVLQQDDSPDETMEMIITDGRVTCLGSSTSCAQSRALLDSSPDVVMIALQSGHVLPGLTAVTPGLGMREIADLESTGDGESADQKINEPDSVVFAKYGVWLDGKQFARARLGGVTRAISPPVADASGMVHGVSVEILTSGQKSLLHGGIVQKDVALHIALDDQTRSSEGTISRGVQQLRKMLDDGAEKNNATVYGRAARGELPLVIHSDNKYDLQQIISIKQDYPDVYIVIEGGKEAPAVAEDLAKSKIPLILTNDRGAPDTFRDKDATVGPPLTRSIANYLVEAGVHFAVAINDYPMRGSWRLHDLAPEASWTAKFAGLNESTAVQLVSRRVEEILRLPTSHDMVIFEGSPLAYGASVVLAFHADSATGALEVATCYPQEDELAATAA